MKPEQFDVSLWVNTLKQCDDKQTAANLGKEMLDAGCLGNVLRDERVMGEPIGFRLLWGLKRLGDSRAIPALIDGISPCHVGWNGTILDVHMHLRNGIETINDLKPALARLITACPRELNLNKIDPSWASSAYARDNISAILQTIVDNPFGATGALTAISGWEQTPEARAAIPGLVQKLAQWSQLGPREIVRLLDKIDSEWRRFPAASEFVPTLARYSLLRDPCSISQDDESLFLRRVLDEIDPCWHEQIDWNAILPEIIRQAMESTASRGAEKWVERLNDLKSSPPILQSCQSELAKLRQELNKGSAPAAMLLIKMRDVASLGAIWGAVARFDNDTRLLSDLARWTGDTGESKYVPQLASLLKHLTVAKWDAAEALARIGTRPAIKALRSFKGEDHKWYHGEDPDMEDYNAQSYDQGNIFECFAHACGGDQSGRDQLYKYKLFTKLSMGTWLDACMTLERLCVPSGTSEEILNTQLATLTSMWESNQEDTAVSLRLARLWEVRFKQVQDEQSLDGALFFYEMIQKKYPKSIELLDYKLATLGAKRHQIRIKLLEDWLGSGGEQHEDAQLCRDELATLRQETLAMASTAAKIKRASFSDLDS